MSINIKDVENEISGIVELLARFHGFHADEKISDLNYSLLLDTAFVLLRNLGYQLEQYSGRSLTGDLE